MKGLICLVCVCSSLCGQTIFSNDSLKVKVQAAPYVYGAIFHPGYGVSVRAEALGHTFELAPMSLPPTKGYFGNGSARIAITGSYYYAFRRNKIFQPYLGISITHLRDKHKSFFRLEMDRPMNVHMNNTYEDELYMEVGDKTYYERFYFNKENFIGGVIGLQVCLVSDKFMSGYLFCDIIGAPISIYDSTGTWSGLMHPEIYFVGMLPRVGAGLQF